MRGPAAGTPRTQSRLGRLAAAASRCLRSGATMNQISPRRAKPPKPTEVQPLARQLASAYRDRVNRHRHELGLSTEEAAAKAEAACSVERTWAIEDCPPEQVTWADLEELNRASPERALRRWEEIKQVALEELQSGHRAAEVLEGRDSHPYQRAQFLAIRQELTDGCQPRNGVEWQLIDTMAQAQAAMFYWQQELFECDSLAGHEVIERAGAMVDRFNRMFLRILRALRDL